MTTTRPTVIRTPDQRLRVFVSSTLQELAGERAAAREAIAHLRLAPVLFELGARPHPPRDLYRAYLDQSHIFIGIYWQKYGWIAPGESISGLEDEYRLSGQKPKLIYIKQPAPDREPRLKEMLDRIKRDDAAAYKYFSTADELRDLIENDLALLLTERFESARASGVAPAEPIESNLPVPPTPIIGREAEVATARRLLLDDETSLVTFTGPGGTGKTRLALQVAFDVRGQFRDGAHFVGLAPVSDPALVASRVAQTLNVRETGGGRSLNESLKDYLHHKQLLLFLDNFEQVIAAALLVGELLEHCPQLKMLVTSRVPLRLRSEREYFVSPLALPDRQSPPDTERLRQSAAVELFVQRALEAKPGFTLTAESAPIVADICHRLDGLPLAIELAAARVKVLSPQALLARLERRLDVLTGGARDLPERQKTLRNTIAWSYDLLEPGARTLFRRLAVFVGGWTLEAAEAVCNVGGDLGVEIMDELESLADNSLLVQSTGPDGEWRYGMLATIREYAMERLVESEDVDALRQRHADFFLKLAETAGPYLTTGQRQSWLATLEIEHDNLRAALTWSRSEKGDARLGLRLAGALDWFWFFRGHLSEGRAWVVGIVAHAQDAENTLSKARALSGAGGLAWAQGDYPAARDLLEHSIALCRDSGALGRYALARSLMLLGFVNVNQGRHEAARALHGESLAISRALGDRWLQALTLSNLGDALLISGDAPAARARYEESLALFRDLADPWGRAIVLYAMGGMALSQGDHAAARASFEESTALCRSVGDRWGVARGLLGAASAALSAGDVQQARAQFLESLSLEHEIGNSAGVVMSLAGLTSVAALQGDWERAAQLAGAVDSLGQAMGSRLWHIFRPIYDRQIAASRARSDASTWAMHYGAGQALTLEQAVVFAVQESDRRATP
jgi:predicted ATPase